MLCPPVCTVHTPHCQMKSQDGVQVLKSKTHSQLLLNIQLQDVPSLQSESFANASKLIAIGIYSDKAPTRLWGLPVSGHMVISNLGLFYWNQAHMKNCKDKKSQFWILNKNSNQPIRRNILPTVRANQILATSHLKSILEFHPFLILHPINWNNFEKPEITENRLIHITCK